MGFSALGFNKDKNELKKSYEVPDRLVIEKSTESKNTFLIVYINKKEISGVIENNEINVLKEVLKSKNKKLVLTKNDLNKFSFEYWYWKDKLYQINIDKKTIIYYQKPGYTIAVIILSIGFLWSAFQLWVIYTLATKGIKVYDESFK
jgi:hypothetical protein